MSDQWVKDVDRRLTELEVSIKILLLKADNTELLLKYVVTPLLIIVGALVGVKMVST